MPNVFEILEAAADRRPGAVALVDGEGALDCAALLARVRAARAALVRHGVGPGAGVGLIGSNGRHFVVAALAAAGSGAVAMPVGRGTSASEFANLLRAAPVHVVLDDGSARPPLAAGKALGDHPDSRLRLSWTGVARERPFAADFEDAAFVRFTSGTTGESKGVVLSHRAIRERIAAANRGLRLGPGDAVLCVLPMTWHFFASILLYLDAGATIVVAPDDRPETLLETADAHGATFLYAMPSHFQALAADDSGRRFRTLRRAVSTSSGLAASAAQAFEARFGFLPAQAYGVIEAGLPLMSLDQTDVEPGSIGRPLPDYEAVLLSENGRPAPEGEAGELGVRGPGLFSGYLSPPRPAEAVLRDGFFMTGDLARRDANGAYRIVGRRKSTIHVAGRKVFPEEIEAALDQHPGVARSRVFGAPGKDGNETLCAEAAPRDAAHPPAPEELMAWCRERLSPLKTPERVRIVERVEVTAAGKIPRRT